jgi:hypothetical protein
MQLIAIGSDIINLDRVSVIDIDPSPQGPVLKVLVDSTQPVIELRVSPQTIASLMNLVPQTLRLPGADTA